MKGDIRKRADITAGELREMLATIVYNQYGFKPGFIVFMNSALDHGANPNDVAVRAELEEEMPPTSRFNPTGPAPTT